MKLLEVLTATNFDKLTCDKKGSIFVEASMVMPLTCIIMITLIAITMTFHSELSEQVREHMSNVLNRTCHDELVKLRIYEKFIDWI